MKTIIRFIFCIALSFLFFSAPTSAAVQPLPQPLLQAFAPKKIKNGLIKLRLPSVAENHNNIPLQVAKVVLPNRNVYVQELLIYASYDLTKPIARLRFTAFHRPEDSRLRLSLSRNATIYAIARLSNGELIAGSASVKITIGGMGGGSSPSIMIRRGSSVVAWGFRRFPPQNTERYGKIQSNPVRLARRHPVSTFSVDVDTGAYSNIRRFLLMGKLPPSDGVRIEEMINYFLYRYPVPKDRQVPFSVSTELAPTPWNKNTVLMRVGLRTYDLPSAKLPPANLVFLIDVSGSMTPQNKLPLIKASLRMLVQKLRPQDRISIVVYAGAAGRVLEPTSGRHKQKILAAITRLRSGGSTNGGQGIKLAYALARQAYIRGGVNRVILATDGDFNVGVVSQQALLDIVKRNRKSGIALTTLGFGGGNYNEKLIEQLANVGNGNYAYIDNLKEAHKVLYKQFSGTLNTVAKDVKIQLQFNPENVVEYRLIGYVNRKLKREDFKNDKVDAGEIGAGHKVTALYELTLKGKPRQWIDPSPYEAKTSTRKAKYPNELARLRLRYKLPGKSRSRLIERVIHKSDIHVRFGQASNDTRFAVAVAAFGQLLRGGRYLKGFSYQDVIKLAKGAMGKDAEGYRREFVDLVGFAEALMPKGKK